APVQALAFTPDSRYLLTGGSDGSVRLFEIDTNAQVLRFDPHEQGVTGVASGPGGRTALSWGPDGLVVLWSLRPARPADASHKALWANLAGTPAAAYQAVWALAGDPKGPALLGGRIGLVAPVEEKRLAGLIADLDSDRFGVREAAFKELQALG